MPYHRKVWDKRRARWAPATVTKLIDGKYVGRKCYVWAWMERHGREPKPGHVIRHLCGNCHCVNPDHLVEGTHKENYQDRYRLGEYTGRPPYHRGTRVNTNKLTEAQVREIRQRYADGGTSHRKLAAEYGVTHPMIQMIVNRKSWAWLD
jgi:hypothetical protein